MRDALRPSRGRGDPHPFPDIGDGAYMTPPFGYNLFLMRAMAPPEIGLGDIYRSIIPFVLVMVVALALVMIFPELALWLPEQHYGR